MNLTPSPAGGIRHPLLTRAPPTRRATIGQTPGGRAGTGPPPTPQSLSRGHSHFGAGPCAAPVGGRAPFLLGTAAPARASRRSGARVAQPGGPPGPFRAAGAEAAAAPLVSFPFLFLGLCGLPPAGPRPLLRGQSGSGGSGWRVFRKFFLRAEGERPAPRVPPAPPPSGLGRGRGLYELPPESCRGAGGPATGAGRRPPRG